MNGDTTWRAELIVLRDSNWSWRAGGKQSTITIRGPSRLEQDQAHRDGESLLKAAENGDTKAARELQRKLNGEATYANKDRP